MQRTKGDWNRYLSGADIPIPECTIVLTQPTIAAVANYGEKDFLFGVGAIADIEKITAPLRAGNSYMKDMSDFQLLLEVINSVAGKEVLDGLSVFFDLCFPSYTLQYDKSCISFLQEEDGELVQRGLVHDFNFNAFQSVVIDLFKQYTPQDDETNYNPVDDEAAAIVEKIKKGREKVRKLKGEAEKDDNNISLYGQMVSVLTIGIPCDIKALYQCTPFQITDMFNRYMAKSLSDQYERMSCVPFADMSNVDAPEPWTRQLYV